MENANKQQEILKKLTEVRSQLSALYSLFNSSIITADEYRAGTINCIDRMLDLKDSINLFSNELYALKKAERSQKLASSAGKIKGFRRQVSEIDSEYSDSFASYSTALSECIQLRTDLMAEVHALCDSFKETIDNDTSARTIKGYNNQIKLIKKIREAIDNLRADYNVKKNVMQGHDVGFRVVKESVEALITSLEKSA